MAQAKKRVFVSFDFDNDRVLKEFIIAQSRNPDSPFEVADWSMKEAAPQRDWETEARERINRSDIVIIMVGKSTYRAPGVLKEVKMARDAGKPLYQIVGYRDSHPTPVEGAGPLRLWNWGNLKTLLGG
jgi:hypothetical protein